MRVSRLKTILLLSSFLLTLFLTPMIARADDDDEDDGNVQQALPFAPLHDARRTGEGC